MEWKYTFGKPRAYSPQEWANKLDEYFKYMKNQTWTKYEAIKSGEMAGELIAIPTKLPLTRKSLSIFAEISEQTIRNYESGISPYEDYFEVTKHALTFIDKNQIEGALVGAYNPNLVARLQGITEKTDVTTNGKEINTTIPTINVQVNSSKTDFASSESEVDA